MSSTVSNARRARNLGVLWGGLLGALFATGGWWVSRGTGDLSDAPLYFVLFGALPASVIGSLAGAGIGALTARRRKGTTAPPL